MPTYQLIASNELSSDQSSVTFSSIPATFTDLALKITVRGSDGGFTNGNFGMRFNGVSSSVYSRTFFRGDGSGAAVGSTANNSAVLNLALVGTISAQTFSSMDVYIPSYLNTSIRKQNGSFTAMENNSSSAYLTLNAGRDANSAAISSITFLFSSPVQDIKANSKFYLYGISNA